MLKLTKKADYALMAMKHLADHAHEGTRSASAKDVADSFGIPPEALAKILQRLAKAGLLHSQHGTNGGWMPGPAADTNSAPESNATFSGARVRTPSATGRSGCVASPTCDHNPP